ncbi:MAG: DNA recombination protein RmuC [Candidatus Woesebacteria bacterium]|jgi:DNA recombination protein RmuC
MDPVILVAIVIGALVFLGLFINRKLTDFIEKQKPSDELMEIIKMLQEGSKEDRRVLLDSLQKNTKVLNERLDNAARVIGNVQKNIGEMSEIGRGMKELQEFLQSPKLRGNIGEEVLKDLIEQTFPKNKFHLQYTFKSGQKVDAALKTVGGMIPIDSKFPMENYQKMTKAETKKEKRSARKKFVNDVRKHVRDISSKYILPEEGTLDFALMYVPSETVWYEIVNSVKLTDYARKHRIYPVSPTTLYAHLRMVLLSFEGQKIEERSRQALQMVRAIQRDYEKVGDNLGTLQRHLNNAYNMMSNVLSSFTQLGQKITTTRSLGESNESKVERLSE